MKSLKTLFTLIILLTACAIPFYCSYDDATTNNSNTSKPDTNTIKNIKDDEPATCCNSWANAYPDCYGGGGYFSLSCNGYDEYIINCQCCRCLWDTYGPDEYGNLNYDGPPCPSDPGWNCGNCPDRESY